SRPTETPAEGMIVRKEHIPDATIPAFTYGVDPAIPPRPVSTLGSRLLLITHREARAATVIRVLEAMLGSRWAAAAQPPIDKPTLALPPEFPMHPGAVSFRDRDEPVITGESLGFLSNALQILLPFSGGVLCLHGWLLKRKENRRERV